MRNFTLLCLCSVSTLTVKTQISKEWHEFHIFFLSCFVQMGTWEKWGLELTWQNLPSGQQFASLAPRPVSLLWGEFVCKWQCFLSSICRGQSGISSFLSSDPCHPPILPLPQLCLISPFNPSLPSGVRGYLRQPVGSFVFAQPNHHQYAYVVFLINGNRFRRLSMICE